MTDNTKPLVSIAVIVFNGEKLLESALDSALSQDYSNIEIVISDDASTDGTQEIIKDYQKRYPEKIKPLFSKKNQGITNNWFKCMQACSGKYVASLDSDDEFLPGKISKQVAIMENDPNIAVCYTDASVYCTKLQKEIYHLADKTPPKSGGVKTALSDCLYYSPTIMHRNDLMPKKNIFSEIRHAADLAFYKELMILSTPNGKIYYHPETLYIYKKHGNNITSSRKTHYNEHISAIKILQKEYPEFKNDLDPSIYDFCCVGFFKTLSESNIKNTLFFISEGLKASKGNPFKFLRATIWALQFYWKKKMRY